MTRRDLITFAIAPVLSACALAAYIAGGTVTLVMVLFWLSVIALVGTLLLARRSWRMCAASVACGAALLYSAAPSAVTWTLWTVRGFAP
jgi:hypothetical protein